MNVKNTIDSVYLIKQIDTVITYVAGIDVADARYLTASQRIRLEPEFAHCAAAVELWTRRRCNRDNLLVTTHAAFILSVQPHSLKMTYVWYRRHLRRAVWNHT